MKPKFFSIVAVAATLAAAAPLAASEVKPVQPVASTQAAPVVLGGLTTAQATIMALAIGAGVGAVANGGGSSNNTPNE